MPTPAKRPTSLAALRDKMEKQWGNRVSRQDTARRTYEIVSTGSLGLDLATRVGGLVRGRIHELVGVEGVGKTTLLINAMREHQQRYPDLAVGMIDMEQTWDWDWAEANGLDISEDRFIHVYPDNSEDVSDQIKEMTQDGLLSMISVDSIGGMESQGAFDKDAEKSNMGKNAQIITRMVKHTAVLLRRTNTTGVFVNQLRANFADQTGKAGDVSAGPKVLKYSTTMKIDMRRTAESTLKVKRLDGNETVEEIVGQQVRARVVRSKVAAQGRAAEFWIINQDTPEYGPIGIDRADEALSLGIRTGVIGVRGGGHHDLPDGTSIRGRDLVLARLRSEPDLALQIRDLAVQDAVKDVKQEEGDLTFEQTYVGEEVEAS